MEVLKLIYTNFLPTGFNHTFIFYDADGDLNTTNDQWVIQGEPDTVSPVVAKLIIFNTWAGVDSHVDLDVDNDGYADKSATDLNLVDITYLFTNAADGWQELSENAQSLGQNMGAYYNTWAWL